MYEKSIKISFCKLLHNIINNKFIKLANHNVKTSKILLQNSAVEDLVEWLPAKVEFD